MKVFPVREFVAAAKRGAMTPARKRRLWEACDGICIQCGDVVEMYGPTVRYDHEIALELGGSDDDSNIGPIHRKPCDLIKCAEDARKIAELHRQQKMRLDVPVEPAKRPIPQRADPWPKVSPKLQGRGFSRRPA